MEIKRCQRWQLKEEREVNMPKRTFTETVKEIIKEVADIKDVEEAKQSFTGTATGVKNMKKVKK